jgi:DNA/RNA-binding domain of Phe-tRNA-synthetase-like protein
VRFRHSSAIWTDFPELVPGVLAADGVSADTDVEPATEELTSAAAARLRGQPPSALPEIQAWRRAFRRMGFEPTQYRCASESLLRRFAKEGALPRIHPLIDLCNAFSLAFAVPIAVFDVDRVHGDLEVRYGTGTETYESFSGEVETAPAGEVVFADDAGQAHARRWTHRQSGRSAVRDGTRSVLIVAEALHDSAGADIARLVEALEEKLRAHWPATTRSAVLSAASPDFER